MSTENSRALKRRRTRRAKIRKLLVRLANAPESRDRVKLVDKLWKINSEVIPPEALEKR